MSTKKNERQWWVAENEFDFVIGCGDHEIASVGVTMRKGSTEEAANSRANACLMAASPELLEALQNLLGTYDTPLYRRKMSDFEKEAIEQARETVKMATGK
jgi:hypothetical protein